MKRTVLHGIQTNYIFLYAQLQCWNPDKGVCSKGGDGLGNLEFC